LLTPYLASLLVALATRRGQHAAVAGLVVAVSLTLL